MMKKYEAAQAFLELVKSHPGDFTASVDSGRDHCIYTVRHVMKNVSISIDTTGGIKAVSPHTGLYIQFVSEEVLRELYQWASEKISNEKLQSEINKDNLVINGLIEYYSENC